MIIKFEDSNREKNINSFFSETEAVIEESDEREW